MSSDCCDRGKIVDVDCFYEDGKFTLATLPACLPTLFTARFRAPADYAAGDVVVVKGKELPVRTPGMAAAASDIFKAGAVIHCDIDLDRELAFFWQGGGGSAMLPNLSYEEQFAGFYDLAGDKVYVKTIELGALPNGSGQQSPVVKEVSHNIGNIKKKIDMKVIWQDPNGMVVGNFGSTSDYVAFSFYTTVVKMTVYGANRSHNAGLATLYYTCTDR